jgi:Domain of unknown function (DUF4326)
MRKPSHLFSKTQVGSSKGASVSVASMGWSHLGSLDSRGMVHCMAKPAGQARVTAERPRRVQLRRAKGWRIPANTVKVDRATLFGNPFSVKEHGHDRAVALHRAWLTGRSIGKGLSKELLQRRKAVLEALPALRGKNLACWCPLPEHGEPDNCHAALLLELANR